MAMETLTQVSDDFRIEGTPEYTFTYSSIKNGAPVGVTGQINGGCGRTSINQFIFLNTANEKDNKFDVYEGKDLHVGLNGTIHDINHHGRDIYTYSITLDIRNNRIIRNV